MNTPKTTNKELSKQVEYAKQQQQLRELGNVRNNTNSKVLSADSMIEDLLSKKETFQKRNPESHQNKEGPGWLVGSAVPALYQRVWAGVQTADGLADTPVLFSVLMSSGLSTDTLGYIWSLANRTVPGALTQPELYLVLALVGLAQTGYVVNNLAALHQLPQAPVPTLDLSLLPTRTTGPHVYPNPLNVTSLPDPVSFNWVSSDKVYPSTAEKIGISYVSSGPMVNPNLLTEQATKAPTENQAVQNTMNISLEPKTNANSKHSATYSFSFPSLSESPSHIPGLKPNDSDSFDDEFTDFQSADFTSAETEKSSSPVADNEEFTNFQTASAKFDNDDLSVMVVSGRNIPSTQQLWVSDRTAFSSRNEGGIREMFISKSDKAVNDKQGNLIKTNTNFETKGKNIDRYFAFQDIDEDKYDKYSVFHNPLPDDEDKQSVASGNTMESVPLETKSIFNHSLFNDPEPSLDLFAVDHQKTSLEFDKFNSDSNSLKDVAAIDCDEFSDFQTFPLNFLDSNSIKPDERDDKYDVFRTIVFEDNAVEPAATQETKSDMIESNSQRQLLQTQIDMFNNAEHDQKEDSSSLSGETGGSQNFNDMKFGDFQESVVLPLTDNTNIDNLFSSLAISDKDTKSETSMISGPTEDKYKALRLLETTTGEADDFGEFLGAELPNSGYEPPKNQEQASIQIRCLEACLDLLKAGLSTLTRASSQDVVSEILSDPRGNNYLDCLLEVYRVSERIFRHLDPGVCAETSAELHSVWDSLSPYFSHAEHNHMPETVGAVCGVCRSNTGPSPVTFGALSFHSPCANLYLHCVEPVLPHVTVQ